MRTVILLVCCAFIAISAGESYTERAWAMRSRVWCDTEAGYTFRYPYTWTMPGMFDGVLDRGMESSSSSSSSGESEGEITIEGKNIRIITSKVTAKKDTDLAHDVTTFSVEDPSGELDAIGNTQAKVPLTWADFDYYRKDPTRPFADPKSGAPAGVTARLGTAKDRCALVVRYGTRVSGLVLTGTIDREGTRAVIDSFEMLTVTDKGGKKTMAGSWRERQCKTGKVIGPDGSLVDGSKKGKSVSWALGWELETQHYHITTHTNPARLMQHGVYYEALYKAYCEVYEPDKMPPVKFEVHVFDKNKDFLAASNAWGNGIPSGPGMLIGGFFVPSLLSLWVYEESGQLGGKDFTVEHVSAHECSHQFLHLACNGSDNVPTWINEGLAVYFECGVFQGGKFVTQPPKERIGLLKEDYARDKAMLAPPESYLDHKGHINARQYGEVYAMVHFWVFGSGKIGKDHFHTFWQALRKGEEGSVAFERIFMADMIKTFKGDRDAALAAWQEEMVKYVKNKTPNSF